MTIGKKWGKIEKKRMPKMKDKLLLEARRERKKQAIIDSCRKTFAENGIEATSISTLCHNAHVNPKVMYDFFSSKDEIILACVSRSFNGVSEIITRNMIESDAPLFDNLDRLLDECFAFRGEIRFLYQVIVSPQFNARTKQFIKPLHDIYDVCRRSICEKYALKTEEVDPVFSVLIGAIDYYCLLEDEHFLEMVKKLVYPDIKRLTEKK